MTVLRGWPPLPTASAGSLGAGWCGGQGRAHLGEVEGRDDPPEPVAESLQQAEAHEQADRERSSHVGPGIQAHGLGQAGWGRGRAVRGLARAS